MIYQRLIDTNDADIPQLCRVMNLPRISRFISYDKEKYWQYITSTATVFYYKVYEKDDIVGAIHLEIENDILHMCLLVFPQYQNQGIGRRIIQDIQDGMLPIQFSKIKVAIDESNVASICLFQKMNFKFISKEAELLTYVYQSHI